MVNINNLYIIDGDFRKGETVTVSMDGIEAKRKVYYSRQAGENYIHFDGFKYFQHKFKTKSPLERVIKHLEKEGKFADEEKERCAKENPLQFDRAVGYSNGIFNAIDFIKGEME